MGAAGAVSEVIKQFAMLIVTVLNDLFPPFTVLWITRNTYTFTSELLTALTVRVLSTRTMFEFKLFVPSSLTDTIAVVSSQGVAPPGKSVR